MEKQRRVVKRVSGRRVWLQGWVLKRVYSPLFPDFTEEMLRDYIESRTETQLSEDIVTRLMQNLQNHSPSSNFSASVPSSVPSLLKPNQMLEVRATATKSVEDVRNQVTILDDDDE